jgi:GTP-binding protein Era
VCLVGRPNAGKSTLLNRFVGTKIAIVSDKPQTTRNRILGVRNEEDAQIVFVDTPGIHRPLHRLNARMVQSTVQAMREADVLGLVVDASEPTGRGDQFVKDMLKRATAPVCLILNKIDLMGKPALLPMIDALARTGSFADIVPVSAKTGDNVERLLQAIMTHLPEGEPLYATEYVTDQPERFLVAEIVREKVLQFTRDELPFASAVVIDRWDGGAVADQAPAPLRLYGTIVVERESQKPIVIGRGGEMIRRIGTAARREIEEFLGVHVFLDLRVQVRRRWREDDELLSRIGVGGEGT